MTKYKERMKLAMKNTDRKYIIDEMYLLPTPIGDTVFYRLRSRRKDTPDIRATEWSLDEYFDVVE